MDVVLSIQQSLIFFKVSVSVKISTSMWCLNFLSLELCCQIWPTLWAPDVSITTRWFMLLSVVRNPERTIVLFCFPAVDPGEDACGHVHWPWTQPTDRPAPHQEEPGERTVEFLVHLGHEVKLHQPWSDIQRDVPCVGTDAEIWQCCVMDMFDISIQSKVWLCLEQLHCW